MSESSRSHLPPDAWGPLEPFLQYELRTLELLFDDVDLTALRRRIPLHPAVIRYNTINAFLKKQQGLQYPDETSLVLEIGSLLLDGFALIEAGLDVTRAMDPEVLRQLRARASDPEQFGDQMAALAFWGMLRSKGIGAEIVEREGLPDIFVPLAASNGQWVEVKRIRLGTRPRRVRDVIGDANDQMKRAEPNGIGSVYLQIERPQHKLVFDDAVPPQVQSYLSEVQRELGSGHSRSVAEVIVAWDDYMVLGTPPERTSYFLRRRTLLFPHRTPRGPSRLPRDSVVLGRTVMLPIIWRGGPQTPRRVHAVRAGNITVTELFRQECELTGDVRTAHAIEVLQNPEARAEYEIDGEKVILATRRVTLGYEPYTLLIIASSKEDGRTDIYLGFRLYDEAGKATGEMREPFEVFRTLLERYGTPVEVGDQVSIFIPRAKVPIAGQAPSAIVRGRAPEGEPFLVSAIVKVNEPDGIADVAWAFAILTGRYRANVRTHNR